MRVRCSSGCASCVTAGRSRDPDDGGNRFRPWIRLGLAPMQSTFYRRCFQIVTAALLGYGLYKLLNPLFGMIGWAVVLAFILHPLQEKLTRHVKGRRSLSAGILTVLTPFFVLVPVSVLGVTFAGQVARLLQYLRDH